MSETRAYFAATTLGLEPALAAELAALGAREVRELRGGASFQGDRRTGYAAALWLRSAIRVMELVLEGRARTPEELYELVRDYEWEGLLGQKDTLAVEASVRDSKITHSKYAALKVKDAIVDRFRDRTGARPDVSVENPVLPLRLALRANEAALYRDLSGESLHKRGWRPIQVKSPLNEAIAAGILLLSGWDRASSIVDPMCGSGTFPIEAAMMAADRAPGLRRHYAFERWPDFDDRCWRALRQEAHERARASLSFEIEGSDRHEGAIRLARKGAAAAGVAELVRFSVAGAADFVPRASPALVFVNPPYGERLGEGEDLARSWRDLGRFLHERCRGASAFVLSGNAELTRHLGLRAARKWVVRNGPIECRLVRYDIFEGGLERSRDPGKAR